MARIGAAALAAALGLTPAAAGLGLEDLTPGAERTELLARLAGAGLRAARYGRRSLRVDATLLPEVYAPQTLLLEFDALDALSALHLQIEPPAEAGASEVLRLYAEVRSALLRRRGPASWERSSGSAAPRELLSALSSGRIVRQLQWNGPPALRAGIPLRSDGRVVVQVLVSTTPIAPGLRLWGRDDF